MSYQSIQILGRVGKGGAELRYTPTGAVVASFSLASNENCKDANGQKQERVTWHRCTLWGKAAEALSEYITQGKMVFVDGTVSARGYLDKGGDVQASLEVKVNQFRFAGGDSGNAGQGESIDNVHIEDSKELPF